MGETDVDFGSGFLTRCPNQSEPIYVTSSLLTNLTVYWFEKDQFDRQECDICSACAVGFFFFLIFLPPLKLPR